MLWGERCVALDVGDHGVIRLIDVCDVCAIETMLVCCAITLIWTGLWAWVARARFGLFWQGAQRTIFEGLFAALMLLVVVKLLRLV